MLSGNQDQHLQGNHPAASVLGCYVKAESAFGSGETIQTVILNRSLFFLPSIHSFHSMIHSFVVPSIPFHSIPFHSFRPGYSISIPFRHLFHSIPFHSMGDAMLQ